MLSLIYCDLVEKKKKILIITSLINAKDSDSLWKDKIFCLFSYFIFFNFQFLFYVSSNFLRRWYLNMTNGVIEWFVVEMESPIIELICSNIVIVICVTPLYIPRKIRNSIDLLCAKVKLKLFDLISRSMLSINFIDSRFNNLFRKDNDFNQLRRS